MAHELELLHRLCRHRLRRCHALARLRQGGDARRLDRAVAAAGRPRVRYPALARLRRPVRGCRRAGAGIQGPFAQRHRRVSLRRLGPLPRGPARRGPGVFRDLTDEHGYELETAGALRGGRRFWALARTGRVAVILGEDEIRDYLLLSTSCDGSLATTAQYTSIRVVCNNTLSYAVEAGEAGADIKARKVRVQHSARFDADSAKGKLGASIDHWAAFIARTTAQAKQGISVDQAVRYFAALLKVGETVAKSEQRKIDRLMQEWTAGVGAEMTSARGTVWGLVNAVTHMVDQGSKERTEGATMNNAWFGNGARLKAQAFAQADALVAA